MSIMDTAIEIRKIMATAGISGEIIALMEKKLILLTDELVSVNKRLSASEAHNKQLISKIHDLEKQKQGMTQETFVENDGILWKRANDGFEKRPYCPICPNHPVMMGFPPGGSDLWTCPFNHTFDFHSNPPKE